MSKYDTKKNDVERMLAEGCTLIEICNALDIPLGTINYLRTKWGLTNNVQLEARGGWFTRKGKRSSIEGVRRSHRSGNRKHPFAGKVALRGQWVTREEFLEEAQKCLDQDMTYAEMTKDLGVTQATIWARLKEANLLQGIRRGDRAPTWRGGHRKYRGPNWQGQRKKSLERDGYICQDCGKTNAQELKERGKQLSVHHLIPYEESKDSSLSNLISLCNSCHMKREYTGGRFASPI